MKTISVRKSLFVTIGSLAATTSVAAPARDIVALRHGSYVQADTACAEASNATTQTFTGRGFDTATGAQCVARRVAGKPGTFAQTCADYRVPVGAPRTRSTEMLKLRVLSRTSYTEGGTRFRFCPGVR